ncbi:MAG: hypothetical protein ACLVJO_04190 [[Clostridium] scindens]
MKWGKNFWEDAGLVKEDVESNSRKGRRDRSASKYSIELEDSGEVISPVQ